MAGVGWQREGGCCSLRIKGVGWVASGVVEMLRRSGILEPERILPYDPSRS